MPLEIVPEPSEEERRAIEAALAAEASERAGDPSWAQALLPSRSDESDRPDEP